MKTRRDAQAENKQRVAVEQSPVTGAYSLYRLEKLLVGMTPKKMSEVFDWGPDIGREVVE